MSDLSFQLASKDDAAFLAHCILEVSAGVVDALLTDLLPMVGAEQILTMVMGDTSSHFSHKNCVLAREDKDPVGLLFCYPASEQKVPPLMRTMIPASRLDPLLDILTAVVPESLYINTFWVAPSMRGEGLSDVLMDYAADWAGELGLKSLSLFAWSGNARALSFYARHGFVRESSVDVPPWLEEKNGQGGLYFRALP